MSNLDRRPAAQELGGLEATAGRAGAGPAAGQGGAARREHPRPPAAAHPGPAAGRARGRSSTTTARTTSPRAPACRWRRTRTPGCRRCRGCSRARCTTATPSAATSQFGPGELALMTAGPRHRALRAVAGRATRGSCTARSCGWRCPTAPATSRRPSSTTRRCPASTSDGLTTTVLMGSFGGATSPGTAYTPLVGVDLDAGRRAPTSSCRWSRTSSTALLASSGVGDGRGRAAGRAARCSTSAPAGASLRLRADRAHPAAAARRRAVRGADGHVVELRRPVG